MAIRINLNNYPSYPKTYTVTFPKLTGGLNTSELDYRLGENESPNMRNLWWQDGVIQCRDGQELFCDLDDGELFTMYGSEFHDHLFAHVGSTIVSVDRRTDEYETIISAVPENRGTFFQYDGALYYKNRGGYFKISYDAELDEFEGGGLGSLEFQAYIPTVLVNTDPATCAGDRVDLENCLQAAKRITYNGDGTTTAYKLPVAPTAAYAKVNGVSILGVTLSGDTLTFPTAPAAGQNNVEVTYVLENTVAYDRVMSCIYATVTPDSMGAPCVLFGGCESQPNLIQWNYVGKGDALDPTNMPVDSYQLIGDTDDPVTGFAKQYSYQIVLKERSIYNVVYTEDTGDIEGLRYVNFIAKVVNPRIGCDCPWTIETINNNTVFCNTKNGVHIIKSSSSAYENNVDRISDKVNGTDRAGLLYDVRNGKPCCFDDGTRYWLVSNGHAYLWDYDISSYQDPSWFYFTNINAVCFSMATDRTIYNGTNLLRLSITDGEPDPASTAPCILVHERTFRDIVYVNEEEDEGDGYTRWYDYGPIDKYYQFPTQNFSTYDRLKDVLYTIISVRSDTDTDITLTYYTDYEDREDLTDIASYSWRLSPRNLARRELSVARYASVAKRTPGCKHVRHFAMSLRNNNILEDLSIVTAQIFYRFSGKER